LFNFKCWRLYVGR